MEANEQKVVPIYQRPFAWYAKDCKRMWDDLIRVADGNAPSHFFGAVVDVEDGVFTAGDLRQVSIIDGQQRLTAFTLLLLAIVRVARKRGAGCGVDPEKIAKRYFFTDEDEGEARYKLLLTRRDKSTLNCLVDGRPLPQEPSELLVHDLEYFEKLIGVSDYGLDSLFDAVKLLTVVEIKLDRKNDDPQLIFESLNSTGVKLTQADLIRNFLLMDLTYHQQADLYSTYWYPMEQSFAKAGLEKDFDSFMRDFLTVQTGEIPRTDSVYEKFKEYRRGSLAPDDVIDLVSLIAEFAGHFIEIQTFDDWSTPLGKALRDYRALKLNLPRPLLLSIWADYGARRVSAEERIDLVRLVESYIFRRATCGLRSNPLDKVFAEVLRAIDRSDYVASIATALVAGQSTARFPDDTEFIDRFTSRDVYTGFSHAKYLLVRLENLGRKEPIVESSVSIEHCLPQNPKVSKAWQDELGPEWARIHLELLNCVGNLTLTAYNSELGDRSFAEKKKIDGGFCDTPYRLSKAMCKADRWDEASILARAQNMGGQALKSWARPAIPEERLEAYRQARSESHELKPGELGEYSALQGGMLALYEALQEMVDCMGEDIARSVWKTRISFTAYRIFLNVVPQKTLLRLYLNVPLEDLDDPRGLAREAANGRVAMGATEVEVDAVDNLEYIGSLIRQAYALNSLEQTGANVG